jgi:Tfp pilus assembly protein PilF
MTKKILKFLLCIFFISNPSYANNKYFEEGLKLFENKKFEEAKFKFEKEIVYNPKNELSYLYLSKIYKNLKNKKLEEQNLNTVILLNPLNEEAVFNLANLKLDESDYLESKELNKRLQTICKKFCTESQKLTIEIENLSKK